MAPTPPDEKAFTATSEAIKQLITVAAGVLALTITFVKDLLQDDVERWLKVTLLASWGAFVFSILFGIFGLGAIAGQLGSGSPAIGDNIKKPAVLQFWLFVGGIALLSVFGGFAFWDFDPTASDSSTPTATAAPTP
jgi:hypothetical protein